MPPMQSLQGRCRLRAQADRKRQVHLRLLTYSIFAKRSAPEKYRRHTYLRDSRLTPSQRWPCSNTADTHAHQSLHHPDDRRPHPRLLTRRYDRARPLPEDKILLGDHPELDVAELHRAGFRVIPWNPNDPEVIRTLIHRRVDGIISDCPDILQTVLAEERTTNPTDAAYFASFDVSGHRGARGLRPENTLPAFEAGLDHLITTIETDTGVTTDYVSLIWRDQFLSPESCRRADGTPYTLADRVYLRDISSHEAQQTFICDKLHSASLPRSAQRPHPLTRRRSLRSARAPHQPLRPHLR